MSFPQHRSPMRYPSPAAVFRQWNTFKNVFYFHYLPFKVHQDDFPLEVFMAYSNTLVLNRYYKAN